MSGLARRSADALQRAELDPRSVAMVAVLILLWIALDRVSEGLFLTPRNLYNLAVQTSAVAVMATGMVLVIVARHIDLSVGSLLGLTGMLAAWFQVEGPLAGTAAGWLWALALAPFVGALAGAWQGFWVAYRGVPAFVVTLGGLLVFRGAAYWVTEGRTVAPLDPAYEWLGSGAIGARASWAVAGVFLAVYTTQRWRLRRARRAHSMAPLGTGLELSRVAGVAALVVGFVAVCNAYTLPRSEVALGLPVPVLIAGLVAAAMHGLSRRTRFGRYVFAIGGSPAAAVRAGIAVPRTTLALFALMGALCGVASILTTARLGAGTNSMGTLAELSVIAAAVIGGTSLAGGAGSVLGALLGATVMQSLENGMVLLGVSSATRQVASGLVLIVAVWLDSAARRRAELS